MQTGAEALLEAEGASVILGVGVGILNARICQLGVDERRPRGEELGPGSAARGTPATLGRSAGPATRDS